MADLLVSEGYKDAGYVYVNIDDCWMEKQRNTNGSLVADRKRFPRGIKWLADYMHSKGLKLGIYEDFGRLTCAGYPGSKFYLERDAESFASWGVDMVKLDGCNTDIDDMNDGYPAMSFFLNQTRRPMLFSCEWAVYFVLHGRIPDYKRIANYCNIWRNYNDAMDSWDSLKDILHFYGNDNGNFSAVAGPGNFNDPDALIIGNFGLSYDQQRVQMALYSIMASPLLMSADLQQIRPESKELLLNKYLISINQDQLGYQGRRLYKNGYMEVWMKIMGIDRKNGAFAFLNLADYGGPTDIGFPIYKLGLNETQGYNVYEAFIGSFIGLLRPNDIINATVNPSGVWMGIAYLAS